MDTNKGISSCRINEVHYLLHYTWIAKCKLTISSHSGVIYSFMCRHHLCDALPSFILRPVLDELALLSDLIWSRYSSLDKIMKVVFRHMLKLVVCIDIWHVCAWVCHDHLPKRLKIPDKSNWKLCMRQNHTNIQLKIVKFFKSSPPTVWLSIGFPEAGDKISDLVLVTKKETNKKERKGTKKPKYMYSVQVSSARNFFLCLCENLVGISQIMTFPLGLFI